LTQLLKDAAEDLILLFYHLEIKWLAAKEMVERIRLYQKKLPVTIICNDDTLALKEECMQAGASGFLIEPVLQESIANLVLTHITH
jgi:FixJ family two-component response regulator